MRRQDVDARAKAIGFKSAKPEQCLLAVRIASVMLDTIPEIMTATDVNRHIRLARIGQRINVIYHGPNMGHAQFYVNTVLSLLW